MKTLKSIGVAGLLAAGLTGSALANTTVVIHIVGAPAFRQPVNDAIETVVEGYSGAGLTATTAKGTIPAVGSRTTGSTIEGAKANQWLIPNFVSGSIDLEINASYTGSTAGVESVASQAVPQNFIPDSFATAANVSTPQDASSTPVAVAATSAATPDVNWISNSDTFQASTLFNGAQTFYGAARNGSPFTHTYQTLTADLGSSPGGVEVYHWVASPNAPSDFTNITTEQAYALYKTGALPLSYFTGSAADASTTVYALSRDPGSGARTIALAEIGLQAPGTNFPIQSYVPTISAAGVLDTLGSYVGGSITGNGQQAAQAIPSTGIYEPAGDAGYASFGTTTNGGSIADSSTSSQNSGLLQAITAAPPAGSVFVTYLDNDDTNEALAAGIASGTYTPPATGGSAKLLTFNGVAASLTRGVDPVVANGEYTFWSYESFLSPSGQSSTATAFETQVEAAFPPFAALPASDLKVDRTGDGVNQVY